MSTYMENSFERVSVEEEVFTDPQQHRQSQFVSKPMQDDPPFFTISSWKGDNSRNGGYHDRPVYRTTSRDTSPVQLRRNGASRQRSNNNNRYSCYGDMSQWRNPAVSPTGDSGRVPRTAHRTQSLEHSRQRPMTVYGSLGTSQSFRDQRTPQLVKSKLTGSQSFSGHSAARPLDDGFVEEFCARRGRGVCSGNASVTSDGSIDEEGFWDDVVEYRRPRKFSGREIWLERRTSASLEGQIKELKGLLFEKKATF